MADTTGTSAADTFAAPNASENAPAPESFDLCPGLAALLSDTNDSILAARELLEAADPTDLSVVLLDALWLISLRCEIGRKLASRADIEYTQMDIKILHPVTAELCGF